MLTKPNIMAPTKVQFWIALSKLNPGGQTGRQIMDSQKDKQSRHISRKIEIRLVFDRNPPKQA
jgi:hypothetical protein